ncbi:MAG: homocysteine S-methyltransferase family protein [Oscillospiraceae bacterium]|nr:homocysteine S-methyltransferase family protein [Oscillospiraceae bacterium]
MKNFKQLLNRNHVIFDGAMGTELQKRGLKPGEPSELFNFTSPEKVSEVIRAYAEAGSDIVSANTFCANRYKLSTIGKSPEEVIVRAVEIARGAVHDFPDVLVALDCGPIGQLLAPTGTLSFDEAYEIFAEVVKAGVKSGADLVVLQTFSDLLELKAAILAVKENSDLPLICSMTFEANKRTFTGCPVSAYAVTASALGADVIGVNCSLGPKELRPIADELIRFSGGTPVMVKPNAGLPDPVTGEFMLNAVDFAAEMQDLIIPNSLNSMNSFGVKITGGCCGTTPEYIKLLRNIANTANSSAVSAVGADYEGAAVCSGVKTVVLDRPRVIGERINPTGKRLFKEALINSDVDYILGQALEQTRAGADILDVNVGLPEIDEKHMMQKVIESLQGVCELPLQIDSGDPDVLESALRRYNGRPIVNSVNGKEESLASVLPLVKKYGAMVIGLTLDENGIPETAEARLEIARKILERALAVGLRKEDVIIDCLTLTVSTDSAAAQTTLKAVESVNRELGLKTALGVSNVSFGLPERELLNATFLTMALHNGLSLPIINPNDESVMGAVRAFNLLNGFDENASEFIGVYSQQEGRASNSSDSSKSGTNLSEISLQSAILSGLKKDGAEITSRLLETLHPMDIVNNELIPALDKAGNDFEKGLIFLPQLLLSAETAGVCFDKIKAEIGTSAQDKGTVILATVKGDIHDIGKNIVKVLLENYGYKIIDLGKDVSAETIADSVEKHGVRLVGLSALMTTTLPAMRQTIELLQERGLSCKVMVGGAILTADYADTIGADFYAKDAKGAVDIAKKLFSEKG